MKKDLTKKLFSRDSITLYIVAAIYILVSVMLFSGSLSRQITNMLIPVSCYIVLAVSLNLVVGLLGELSLGHAGFMSAGLFSGCLVSIALADMLPMAVRLPVSMLFGGIIAAIVGLVVGLPALRLRGDYLAIVTLACGEIIKDIINNMKITGGALHTKELLTGREGDRVTLQWFVDQWSYETPGTSRYLPCSVSASRSGGELGDALWELSQLVESNS